MYGFSGYSTEDSVCQYNLVFGLENSLQGTYHHRKLCISFAQEKSTIYRMIYILKISCKNKGEKSRYNYTYKSFLSY